MFFFPCEQIILCVTGEADLEQEIFFAYVEGFDLKPAEQQTLLEWVGEAFCS